MKNLNFSKYNSLLAARQAVMDDRANTIDLLHTLWPLIEELKTIGDMSIELTAHFEHEHFPTLEITIHSTCGRDVGPELIGALDAFLDTPVVSVEIEKFDLWTYFTGTISPAKSGPIAIQIADFTTLPQSPVLERFPEKKEDETLSSCLEPLSES